VAELGGGTSLASDVQVQPQPPIGTGSLLEHAELSCMRPHSRDRAEGKATRGKLGVWCGKLHGLTCLLAFIVPRNPS